MKKKYKIPLVLIVILIAIIIVLIVLNIFKKEEKEGPVKVLDSINNYNYTLDERDTKLMKDNYNELKSILKAKDINYEEYAKMIAKLFVIDLFTMDNKINKYDVGSLEYVYPDAQQNFKLNVEDTIYKHIINNSDGKRVQELPVVKSVEVSVPEKIEYTLNEEVLEAYKMDVTWDYEKDLGYDVYATITVAKKNNTLYVTEYKVGDDNA